MLRKIVLTGIMMGCIYSVSFGAEQPDNKTLPAPGLAISTDMLVLDDKGSDYVMFCKRKYDITSYTLIKNESGMIISLDQLNVPCKAMVSYYKKPGKKNRYVVVSIEVKGESPSQPE